MGTTTSGLWYPDRSTPMGALHTILAQMQNTVQVARDALRTELLSEFPCVGVLSSGSAQALPANTQTDLTGGSNGWITTKNNAAAVTAGMQVHTGVNASPITITQAGTYSIMINTVHTPNVGADFAQQCFTDLLATGGLNLFRRTSWSWGSVASDTHWLQMPAAATNLKLNSFAAGAGLVASAEIMVWKVR